MMPFVFSLIFLFVPILQGFTQSLPVVNGYPMQSGIIAFNSAGKIQKFYPVAGIPSDVEILPSKTEFVVAGASGNFILFSLDGSILFGTSFYGLQDVDPLETPGEFLLTSRYNREVFIFNRLTGERNLLPFTLVDPTDADRLPNGNYLVSDAKANRILELNPEGKIVWSYNDNLKQPLDALRLENGDTLISDFDNHRVIKVSTAGRILAEWKGYNHPNKLTLLPNGAILVTDGDGQRLIELPAQGPQRVVRDNLNYITAAAYLPERDLYLCCVQNKFAPQGTHASSASTQSESDFQNEWTKAQENSLDLLQSPLFLVRRLIRLLADQSHGWFGNGNREVFPLRGVWNSNLDRICGTRDRRVDITLPSSPPVLDRDSACLSILIPARRQYPFSPKKNGNPAADHFISLLGFSRSLLYYFGGSFPYAVNITTCKPLLWVGNCLGTRRWRPGGSVYFCCSAFLIPQRTTPVKNG